MMRKELRTEEMEQVNGGNIFDDIKVVVNYFGGKIGQALDELAEDGYTGGIS